MDGDLHVRHPEWGHVLLPVSPRFCRAPHEWRLCYPDEHVERTLPPPATADSKNRATKTNFG